MLVNGLERRGADLYMMCISSAALLSRGFRVSQRNDIAYFEGIKFISPFLQPFTRFCLFSFSAM
jgi:hypothetical protein